MSSTVSIELGVGQFTSVLEEVFNPSTCETKIQYIHTRQAILANNINNAEPQPRIWDQMTL
ncbi:hypothetical protein T440DRAFT_165627 [Plenodomus tracheiphilus IPT5]|uniref:Uncharacterized protein n=1 Tax=Plenodomus tracheiphilus IPT5 TaxID=1408161 RepID=A0A6A7BK80_9PLEO|nr:hypothetical protein T440DRAFT_165627 [Plenodomus tracheiphilus IPT5]